MKKNKEEKIKLGWWGKWKLKRAIKTIKEHLKETISRVQAITSEIGTIDKKEKEELETLRMKLIVSIIGDKEQKTKGLAELFEITEDEREIDFESLKEKETEEIIELVQTLVEKLEKEV